MSQVYNLEPPTDGKICLHTSFGDIDIELWSKETPLACRNFVQHSLDSYYDGTIFHRIISKFMIQGGDPTGVGDGGVSSFDGGAPFKDEFHSRLKFNHRGLIAMANANEADANGSQFFLTFDSCEWLNKKHTIFGKVVGQTIFNLLRMGELDVDATDRPVDPPRLERVSVLVNPFDDIVARETVLGKGSEGVETEAAKRRKRRKKVNNRTLLSFGDDDGSNEQEEVVTAKMASMHDIAASERMSSTVAPEVAADAGGDGSGSKETRGKGMRANPSKPLSEQEQRTALRAAVAHAAIGAKDNDSVDPKKKVSKDRTPAGGGGGDAEDDEYRELQGRMREQQRLRKERMGGGAGGVKRTGKPKGDIDDDDESELTFDSDGDDNEAAAAASKAQASALAAVAQQRAEYMAQRAELVSSSQAAQGRREQAKAVMQRAKEREDAAAASDSLLTPLQQQRAKFVQRNKDKDLGARQKDTMAALEAFTANLSKAKAPGGGSTTSASVDMQEGAESGGEDEGGDDEKRAAKKQRKQEKKEKKAAKKAKRAAERETQDERGDVGGVDNSADDASASGEDGGGGGGGGYHGQVTEQDPLFGGESDDEGEDWFGGKLKFKKHIDDKFRNGGVGGGEGQVGADGRSAGDYVTVDSRLVDVDALDASNRSNKRTRDEPPRSRGAEGGGGGRGDVSRYSSDGRRAASNSDRHSDRHNDRRDHRRDDDRHDRHRRERSRSRSRGRGDGRYRR